MTISSDVPLRILLVDDDKDDCELFRDSLSQINSNIQLSVSNDGIGLTERLSSPNRQLPHLIFLDLVMPLKGGLECLWEIRRCSILNSIPVIIFTTSVATVDIVDTFAQGANLYVCKPQTFDFLKDTLKKIIHLDWRKYLTDRSSSEYLFRGEVAQVA